jgi:hypothetical protein
VDNYPAIRPPITASASQRANTTTFLAQKRASPPLARLTLELRSTAPHPWQLAPSTGNAVAKISAVSKRGHAIVYPPLSRGSSDELFPASPQGVCEVRGYCRAFAALLNCAHGMIG